MLTELHVADLGIVADLTLVLGRGLAAITGETGAGKTLLVEAVELLVGGRADTTLVRDGAAEARVEGRFVDAETGDEVVLARVVPVDGRSRAYVDGRLATVGELAEVGARLVDLHGQHAHQSLLAAGVQRAALDRFIGPPATDPLAAHRAARAEMRRIDAELAGLGGDDRARAREVDLLRFQIDEIDAAGLDDASEDVALEAEEALLADALAHREALAAAYGAVEGPALDAVGAAAAALAGRGPFAELAERLRATQAELAELGSELRVARDTVEDDPQRLEEIGARRKLLRELTRKYGETLADVRAYAGDSRRRLAELEGYEERAKELEQAREAIRAAGGRGRDRVVPGSAGRSGRPRRGRHAAPPGARHARSRLRGRRGAGRADRRRRRPDHVPHLRQPRGAAPATGQGRVGWRALTCDAGSARGALRGAAHAGVRRGRRRHRG